MALITRIVLAAGRSSRMGETKALMDICGATALERVLRLRIEVDAKTRTLVVCGHDGERVANEARRHGANAIQNENWSSGQTSSLKAGLRALPEETSVVWLHPVDLPMITQDDYSACSRAWQEEGGPSEMLVTSIDKRRGHPLLLGAEWISAFLALADDEPARKVTRSAGDRMHYATVTNHWVRDDLDTPSDLARAIHFLQD